MERPSSGLREMVRRHRPKREDLDPRKWMKRENVKGFTDFITNQHSDRDTDNSFDNKEMCEYWRETRADKRYLSSISFDMPSVCEPK